MVSRNLYQKCKAILVWFFEIVPDKPLYKHALFWWPIFLFIGLGISLAWPIVCFCWPKPQYYDAILKSLSLPIFIASISIPISVAINRFHSSSQKVKGNLLAESNMAFNHYFDHRNHFLKFLESNHLPEPYCNFIKITEPQKLYELLFPNNKLDMQDLTTSSELLRDIVLHKNSVILESIIKEFNRFETDTEQTRQAFLKRSFDLYGITFTENIVEYMTGDSIPMIRLCYNSVKIVISHASKFSHIGVNFWNISIPFDDFIKSAQNDEKIEKLDTHIQYLLDIDSPYLV